MWRDRNASNPNAALVAVSPLRVESDVAKHHQSALGCGHQATRWIPAMYAACLTPGTDPLVVRRTMCGVPRIDALVLPACEAAGGSEWLLSTLRDLRRELFLDPELQVIASVRSADVDKVVRKVAELLVESRCGTVTVGTIPNRPPGATLASWRRAGESLLHTDTQNEFPSDATVVSVEVQLGAAAVVEAVEAEAKIIVTSRVPVGSLGTAAVFEALKLMPQDWDRLATVATIARLIENPGSFAPLWLEIDDHQLAYCIGTETLTAEALELRLEQERKQLLSADVQTDVTIDLASVRVDRSPPGRFQLEGIAGSPPAGVCRVDLTYRMPNAHRLQYWPTSIQRSSVNWDVVVKPASEWNN